MALKRDGTIAAWGDNGWGQGTVPPGLNNIVSFGGGFAYSLALKSDGTVVGWGYLNYSGNSPVPTGKVKKIVAARLQNKPRAQA